MIKIIICLLIRNYMVKTKARIVIVLSVLLCCPSVFSVVEIIDTISGSTAASNNIALAYSPSSGTDRLLLVLLGSEGPGAGNDKVPDSVHLVDAGANDTLRTTLIGTEFQATSNNVSIWQLKDSEIGSNTYSVFYYIPTGVTGTPVVTTILLLGGVNQTTPLVDVDSNATNSATQLSVAVDSTSDFIAAVYSQGRDATSTSWANSWVEQSFIAESSTMSSGVGTIIAPGSGTADVTITGASNSRMVIIAYAIDAAEAAPTAIPQIIFVE